MLRAHLCHLPFPFQQMGSSLNQVLSLLNIIILAVRQAIYIQHKKNPTMKGEKKKKHKWPTDGHTHFENKDRAGHRVCGPAEPLGSMTN